jgi:hypothetical protein
MAQTKTRKPSKKAAKKSTGRAKQKAQPAVRENQGPQMNQGHQDWREHPGDQQQPKRNPQGQPQEPQREPQDW